MVLYSPPWKTTILLACTIIGNKIKSASAQAACDIFSDPCPYQLDGACDIDEGYCTEGDCFDCSECNQYTLDCAGCVANGCFYCPSEGLCYSQALGENYWNQIFAQSPRRTSCNTESQWTNTCEVNPNNFFSDPLYSANEWIYEMMSVVEVWKQGYTGKNVMVRVNDPDGVDVSHPELSANFDLEASCEVHQPLEETSGEGPHHHGTAVASLAVGGGNNGECAVGIAPGANLSACRGPIFLHDDLNPAFNFLDGLATTDVSVNSWGFDSCYIHTDKDISLAALSEGGGRRLQGASCPFVMEGDENPCVHCEDTASAECETYIAQYCQLHGEEEHTACTEYLDTFMDCHFNVLSEAGQAALAKGVTEGRGGKGIVYMIAAGNEHEKWEDVNFEGWLNTRMTTVVAAVGKDGKHASYSTPGSAVLISGPGGDRESISNNIVANLGGGCHDASVGTSFATPSVSGVVALLLEANPTLGWRDVQGVLASTAQMMDPESPTWSENGAGLHHSNLYGFGVVDALAAVEAAKTWINYGTEKSIVVDSGPINLPIADDATTGSTSTITVASKEDTIFTTEAVTVYLDLDYASRGDLKVILTSPLGTESVLTPGKRPENVHLQGDERWKLLTVRAYGENPNGDWKITLRDLNPGTSRDCVDLPYLSTQNDPEVPGGMIAFKCASMVPFCNKDGTLLVPEFEQAVDDETGKSPLEACCACGGGSASVSTVNALVSWKIIVYGHEDRVFVASQGASGTSSNHESSSGISQRRRSLGALLAFALATIL